MSVTLSTTLGPGVLAAGAEPLRLSWRVDPGPGADSQQAYEVQASQTPTFENVLATSGVVESARQLEVPDPGGPPVSREVRHLRVRIRTAAGWSAWSDVCTVEAGLLDPSDWVGSAITLPDDRGADEQAPAPLLRREFALSAEPVRARLHVTSHGLHHVRLNGAPVSDNLLDPGWSAYQRRLLATTHDVTHLLRPGDNAIGAVLGDGWHRGRLGFTPGEGRRRYGDRLGLLAQLEVDLADGSRVVVASDGSWRTSTGELRRADLYDGCLVDLRERRAGWDEPGFDDAGWQPAAVVPLDLATVEPRIAQPVRPVATFDIEPAAMLDAGQNVAGFVRLTVTGKPGQTVTVRHAEVLEPDGSLHTRSLRSAAATDTYVLADEATTTLEPMFTFHGFRYAEVVTEADVVAAQVVAISSATVERGRFACSDETLTRFHENVAWSQRDNFVAVPTDCPQRDERLGWTGDAQAFAPTACTLFESRAFWASWLHDLALDQAADGGVPSVVPNVVLSGPMEYGRAGWADAATIVPWAVYESYADTEVLRRQLPSMLAWIGYLQAHRHETGPLAGLLGGESQFGDWLDPDAPGDQPWKAKADSDFLANAFFAHSARLVARVATVLGETDVAAKHAALGDEIAAATWRQWADHIPTTQTGCAVAIGLDIAPAPERRALGDALARQVRTALGRIATGFLGTPLVLPALAATGHLEEAYLMLLRRQVPSWLYQVDKGATTVWERWDAIRPDGSIHDGGMASPNGGSGHMLSFNHYAYGAVVDWVYRTLAGVAPDPAAPGYQHVLLSPTPVAGITWARASVDSALGRITVDWRTDRDDNDSFHATYEIPFGVKATVNPPTTPKSSVSVDGVVQSPGAVRLGPGRHSLEVTHPRIVDPSVSSIS